MNLTTQTSSTLFNHKKDYFCFLLFNTLFGILLYLTLLSQQLTNHHDALWMDSYFMSGYWELSIGRWFWLVLDRLRFGISSDPFNSYLTLFLIVLGNTALLDLLSVIGKKRAYLFSFMILASTTICCFLSYRYMSPTFGLSYLLSIASIWVLLRYTRKLAGIIISTTLLVLSLGLYQANLGCACLLILIAIILMCFNNIDCRKILHFVSACAFSIIAACIIYKIIWDMALAFFHYPASSYNGANNVSVTTIIMNLPRQIIKSYTIFYTYFFTNRFKHSMMQNFYFYGIIFIFILSVLLWSANIHLRNRWQHIILFCASIICIPVACNISVLLAPEAGFLLQQTAPMAILLPTLLCLISTLPEKNISQSMVKIITVALSAAILYGNIYMTAVDLEVMDEGKTSTETLLNNVVHTLIEENLYHNDKTYIFIGKPSENPLFYKSNLWSTANSYARFGDIWTNGDSIYGSYHGILRNIGVSMNICLANEYTEYKTLEEIQDMPVYPAPDSIQEINGYIVIKISDAY